MCCREEHAQVKTGLDVQNIAVSDSSAFFLEKVEKFNSRPRLTKIGIIGDATPKLGSTISNIFFNGSVSLYCCGSAIAVGSSVVCPSTSDNDGEPFTVRTGRVIPGRALLQNVPQLGTASSTGNDTVAEPGSVSTTCKTCHDTAIGAGVGVPLGALALLFVIWAIIERRRAARLSRALAAPAPVALAPVPVQQQKGNHELSGNSTKKRNNMVELEGARPELDGGESARG